ncbi:hypothetical protein ABXT21_14125 [Ralstonia sp. SM1864_UCD524_TZ4]|uniref:hypothetical protein n=1 Tax=Ralstonia solanacearum species complex TaxID=3116862 RepID=UPI0018D0A62B|nr:hypothetical protein [Ralstonia pseudosolanacearum]
MRVGNAAYRITDLPAMFGMTLARLPVVLRLLLENTLRSTEGRERQRGNLRRDGRCGNAARDRAAAP